MAAAASSRHFITSPPLAAVSQGSTPDRLQQPRLFVPGSGVVASVPRRHATGLSRLRSTAPDAADTAALRISCAEVGDFAEAQSIWAQHSHSSAAQCILATAPHLRPAYAHLGRFDEILLAVRDLSARDPAVACRLYCFDAAVKLAHMEDAMLEMGRLGLRIHSATGDAFIRAYAVSSTILHMAATYRRHKRTGLPIS